jgi:SAM-dependent methyltransferase
LKLRDAPRRLGSVLDTVGMHGPVARLHERWRAARAPEEPYVDPDGVPFPPARLRVLVDWHGGPQDFVDRGSATAAMIRQMVSRGGGVDLEGLGSILDFGCGCGRVARHWAKLSGPELNGCDYNSELVEWCRQNLTFMDAQVNGLEPPTPYPVDRFDLIYAISVLTHLTEPLADAWVAEWARILKPGGLLLVTTHGDVFKEHLMTRGEKDRYERGELVVQRPRVAGMNACTAYHPPSYVSGRLLRGFDILSSPEDDPESRFLSHDVYLARLAS